MKRRAVIEEAVGETRAAVYEGKKIVELYTWRWSDKGKPRAGDIFSGRISRIEPSLGAAFVELGSGDDGFLKFSNAPGAPRLTEGKYIKVFITRDGEAGKGPVLKFEAMADGTNKGPIKSKTLKEYLAERYTGISFDEAAVSSIDEAVEAELAISGGGSIAIERTRALIAIDVDKGAANSGFDVSLAACELIASQVRLRGLGGLFVIDFPNLRQVKQREKIYAAMQKAFEGDLEPIKIAPMSRFGTIEMTRAKTRLSLDETLTDKYGDPTPETLALRGLRQLEREGRSSGGAKLTLTLPEPAFAWLSDDTIGWREAMTTRLGARFTVVEGKTMSVDADR